MFVKVEQLTTTSSSIAILKCADRRTTPPRQAMPSRHVPRLLGYACVIYALGCQPPNAIRNKVNEAA